MPVVKRRVNLLIQENSELMQMGIALMSGSYIDVRSVNIRGI